MSVVALVEPHGLEERLVGRPVAVELAEGGGEGGVELVGGDEQRAGAFEQLQAQGPAAALAQLVVQQLQQRAGPRLLAGADQGAGDAHVIVEIGGIFLDPRQPVGLDESKSLLDSWFWVVLEIVIGRKQDTRFSENVSSRTG